jgi:ATP synthase subunit D
MGDVMKEASFSLAEAKFTMGDFNHLVLQNANKAQMKVKSKKDNVAGNKKLVGLEFILKYECMILLMLILLMPFVRKAERDTLMNCCEKHGSDQRMVSFNNWRVVVE